MSASSRPVATPCAASPRARLTAVVDLPTPPLPEATAMMCLTPGTSGHVPNTEEAQTSSAASTVVSPEFATPHVPITAGFWMSGGSLVTPLGSVLSWKQFPGSWSMVAAARSELVGLPKKPLSRRLLLATSLPKAGK